jgi:ABC-type dipeptide/oligopeptide/nickel transport system permease subunit
VKKNKTKSGIGLFVFYGIAIITLIFSFNFLMDKANEQMASKRAKNRISTDIIFIK